MEGKRNPLIIEATPEELFLMVGEREFTVYKLRQEVARLTLENERLREENGKLGKSHDHD